jgi:stage II sporulation protein AA (anti-sigma F factor antagonist)
MKKTLRSEGGFTPQSVEHLRNETAAFLKIQRVPGPQAYSIVTVVDEMACNILEHAQASFVELELKTGLGVVELLFRDDGIPFDPTEKARQQAALMPGDSQERRLGLYMVASLGDGLRYERRGNLNEVTMVLPQNDGNAAASLGIASRPGEGGRPWQLRLSGKLDVFSFVQLKKQLEGVSAQDPAAKLAVDLSGVEYIASSGWSVLLARRKLGRLTGGDLLICGMSAELRRVYDSMRISKLLPAEADLDAACAKLMEAGS